MITNLVIRIPVQVGLAAQEAHSYLPLPPPHVAPAGGGVAGGEEEGGGDGGGRGGGAAAQPRHGRHHAGLETEMETMECPYFNELSK